MPFLARLARGKSKGEPHRDQRNCRPRVTFADAFEIPLRAICGHTSTFRDHGAIKRALGDQILLNRCAPMPSAVAGMARDRHTKIVTLCGNQVAP
jgi:hypothetical protein